MVTVTFVEGIGRVEIDDCLEFCEEEKAMSAAPSV